MRLRHLTILLLLGFIYSSKASAHHKRQRSQIPYVATNRAVIGHLGIGAIGGYAASSIGLEYEQFVSKKRWFSATLQLHGYLGGTIGLGPIQEGEVWSHTSGYFFAPGIRFHPLRNRYRVDLSTGFYFPLGRGMRRDNAYDSYLLGSEKTFESAFFGAWVGEVLIDFRNYRRNSIFGLFVNAGNIYSNAKAVNYTFSNHTPPNHSENTPLYIQFGFRFGGKW